MFGANLVIFSGKSTSIRNVLTLNYMLNKNFFLIMSKLFFLLADVLVFAFFKLLLLGRLGSLQILIHLAFTAIFDPFCIHTSTRTIHDSHQGFLMATKINLIRRQNRLKALLLILLVFLSCEFANL